MESVMINNEYGTLIAKPPRVPLGTSESTTPKVGGIGKQLGTPKIM